MTERPTASRGSMATVHYAPRRSSWYTWCGLVVRPGIRCTKLWPGVKCKNCLRREMGQERTGSDGG